MLAEKRSADAPKIDLVRLVRTCHRKSEMWQFRRSSDAITASGLAVRGKSDSRRYQRQKRE
jgi:hypothetical protein